MMCVASVPRSCMLISWPGSGQPEALAKCEWVRPSVLASAFIRSAKAASEPASPSATTTQASLPDRTMMPWISSLTLGRSRVLRNMVEPPMSIAFCDTGRRVSIVTLPSLSASNSRSMVISFDIDAGGIGLSAFLASSTVSVVTSST